MHLIAKWKGNLGYVTNLRCYEFTVIEINWSFVEKCSPAPLNYVSLYALLFAYYLLFATDDTHRKSHRHP